MLVCIGVVASAGCQDRPAEGFETGDLLGGRARAMPAAQDPRQAALELELPSETLTPESAERPSLFFGEPDRDLRERLQSQPLTRVRSGLGGRSIAFRVTLEDGTEGYFKPAQEVSSARWNAEVAAHHLDRELGFGRAPVVVSRSFPWSRFAEIAEEDPRRHEVEIDSEGNVRGALVAWISGGVPAWELGPQWERCLRVEANVPVISAFQTNAAWIGQRSGRIPIEGDLSGRSVLVIQDPDKVGALSDLVVFDYLIENIDRWSESYANVRRRGTGGPLLFLDNGAGFWPVPPRSRILRARLETLQRFRRETFEALRTFDVASFRARIESEGEPALLTDEQVDSLSERVMEVVEHIDAMETRFGSAVWID